MMDEKTALADLASLGRVSHRLALVDTSEKLQQVLDKLLPKLLVRIGENQKAISQAKNLSNTSNLQDTLNKIHLKYIEIISHAMKRSKQDTNCKLPCVDLVQNLTDDAWTINLTLAFLQVGLPRETELELLLPGLVTWLGKLSASTTTLQSVSKKTQWHKLTHIFLETLQQIVGQHEYTTSKNVGIKRAKTTNGTELLNPFRKVLKEDARAAGACYDLCLDALLYHTVPGSVPPGGLSQAGHERLRGGMSRVEKDWAAEMAIRSHLCQFKCRLLEWIAPSRRWCLFEGDIERTLCLLVVASGDTITEVSDLATGYLKHYLDHHRGEYGTVLPLLFELLQLAVGANNAQIFLAKTTNIRRLGLDIPEDPNNPQLVLQFRRRAISEFTYSPVASFCAELLEENGQLLSSDNSELLVALGIQGAQKVLSTLQTSTGLTVQRGKSYMAAARLLSALAVQLCNLQSADPKIAIPLLSRCLSATCSVLALVSKPRTALTVTAATTSTSDAGNIAVRDVLYGTLCILSRSSWVLESTWLFGQGTYDNVPVETASLLFGCAANEESTLRPRVVAALDALLAAYIRVFIQPKNEILQTENPWAADAVTNMQEGLWSKAPTLSTSLLPILWKASQNTQSKQSRTAAAQWSSDLLRSIDPSNAFHLLCYMAGDTDVTVASIAKKALEVENELPDFASLITMFFSNTSKTQSSRPNYWEFSPNGKAITIKLCLRSLLDDLYGGDNQAVTTYIETITKTLVDVAELGKEYHELLDDCAFALSTCLDNSSHSRALLTSKTLPLDLQGLETLAIAAASSRARRYLAKSCGSLYEDSALWGNEAWDAKIISSMKVCMDCLTNTSNGQKVHGATYLGAACVRAFRLNSKSAQGWDEASLLVSALGKNLINADDTMGNSAACGLTICLSYDGDDAPNLDSRLYEGTSTALTELAVAIQKYGNGDHDDVPRTIQLTEAAGICLASSTSGTGSKDALGSARLNCVAALFSMLGGTTFRKDEEVALFAGEALAAYADAYSPLGVVWHSQTDTWPDALDENFANGLPPHQQVVYTILRRVNMTSNPHKRTSNAAALFALVARAAYKVNQNASNCHRSLVREVCKHLSDIQDAFIGLLMDSKTRHLCRECCCLGLAACRSLVDIGNSEDAGSSLGLNERLLRAFGQTTNFGGSAMMETRAQAEARRNSTTIAVEQSGPETEVGGASGLSEAALGAYREMAGAAVSLGRPDVLYALLILSVSHPAWSHEWRAEKYSGSALLGENLAIGGQASIVKIRTALRPHLGKLLPRLLRACHDPNKQTREQISNLWNGLTGGGAEAREAITEHLLCTIDALINDASSKLWRARVGACSALAQIIVGRSWQDLGGGEAVLDDDEIIAPSASTSKSGGIRLLQLWRVAVRAMDDVRGTVRDSGELLARGVRGLTIRLCNPVASSGDSVDATLSSYHQAIHEKDASSVAATALAWLIKKGLSQSCVQATGLCISTLVGIVDVTKEAILQPLIPDLLSSLLHAISGLEPAALNYLQVRTASESDGPGQSYDRLERLRLQMAQSGPLAAAVTKCLAVLPKCDLETQKAVVPLLDSTLRSSAGFASRAATADAISSLCSTCPDAFKFQGSSNTNPSVRLLRALYHASERERGQGARDKMSHALGNIANLCPGSSVRSLAIRACDKYNMSQGNLDDPAARRAAAAALRAIAVRASNQFMDGGNSDVWCRRVLPVSYLGMKDTDAKICALWKEVWEEGGASANLAGSTDGFGSLLEEKLLPYLVKESIKAINDVSWSRRAAGAIALRELAEVNILAPSSQNKTLSVSKLSFQEQERNKRRAQSSHDAINVLVETLIKPRLWSGKIEIIKALTIISSKWCKALSDEGICHISLLSSNQEDKICPWQPLLLSSGEHSTDLFLGDGRFMDGNIDQTYESMIQDFPKEKDPTTDFVEENSLVGKIDFEEAEKFLESNNEYETTDKASSDESLKTVVLSGLCRALLTQAFPASNRSMMNVVEEEILPFRVCALNGLNTVIRSLCNSSSGIIQRKTLFTLVAPQLIPVFDAERLWNDEGLNKDEPPLIVARSIDCIAAFFWDGIGDNNENQDSLCITVEQLAHIFRAVASQRQSAWTIREASTLASAALVKHCYGGALMDATVVENMIVCVSQALQDRKFWKVRLSGLKLLQSMVRRAGNSPNSAIKVSSAVVREQHLILESMLPVKESMLKLARQSLSDSEAKVTALATEVLGMISWWP